LRLEGPLGGEHAARLGGTAEVVLLARHREPHEQAFPVAAAVDVDEDAAPAALDALIDRP
jgi:hypothetical protein